MYSYSPCVFLTFCSFYLVHDLHILFLSMYMEMYTLFRWIVEPCFTKIWSLCSNFVECDFFLESNSPNILALYETNLDDSIGSGNFSLRDYLHFSFNLERFYYSYVWSCSLCERRTSFWMGLISRKLCSFLFMFSTGFTSLSVLLLFPLSILYLFHLT